MSKINFNFVAVNEIPQISRGRSSQYAEILEAVQSPSFGENGIQVRDLTTKQVTGLRLVLNKAGLKVSTRWDQSNATMYLRPKVTSAEVEVPATPAKKGKS